MQLWASNGSDTLPQASQASGDCASGEMARAETWDHGTSGTWNAGGHVVGPSILPKRGVKGGNDDTNWIVPNKR